MFRVGYNTPPLIEVSPETALTKKRLLFLNQGLGKIFKIFPSAKKFTLFSFFA